MVSLHCVVCRFVQNSAPNHAWSTQGVPRGPLGGAYSYSTFVRLRISRYSICIYSNRSQTTVEWRLMGIERRRIEIESFVVT